MTFLSLALALLAGLVAAGNVVGIVAAVRRRRYGSDRGFSCVPLVSAIFAGLSSFLGHATLGWWPLLIALLDPGTWTLPLALPFIVREAWRNRTKPS